jgi:hypothetical protein
MTATQIAFINLGGHRPPMTRRPLRASAWAHTAANRTGASRPPARRRHHPVSWPQRVAHGVLAARPHRGGPSITGRSVLSMLPARRCEKQGYVPEELFRSGLGLRRAAPRFWRTV